MFEIPDNGIPSWSDKSQLISLVKTYYSNMAGLKI